MLAAIKTALPQLEQLWQRTNGHWGYEDRIPLPVRLWLGTTLRWNVLEVLKWIEAGCPLRTEWIRINGKSGWRGQ